MSIPPFSNAKSEICLAINNLTEHNTPPTDEDASYHDQFHALYGYYVSHSLENSRLRSPEEMYAYKNAWTGCFPKALFQDDFDLPETSGQQI